MSVKIINLMKKAIKKSGAGESVYTRQLGNKYERQTKRARNIKGRAVTKMDRAVTKGKSTKRATNTDDRAKAVLDKAKATYAKYIKNKKLDAKDSPKKKGKAIKRVTSKGKAKT